MGICISTTRQVMNAFSENYMISPAGCWEWTGWKNNWGYPTIRDESGRPDGAHRFIYRVLIDVIPKGMHIDHLCRNKLCVNPEHLELVTASENRRRQQGDQCKRGHRFDMIKLKPDGSIKQRICSQCRYKRGIPAVLGRSMVMLNPNAARL